MAFTIFQSTEIGAPQLNGNTGSLVAVLDAVLVNGFGTRQSLGWSKPLANDSLTGSLGCWRPPSGSRMILYMNDTAPTASTIGGGRESWVCGYESILGLTSSIYPTTGTGGGQFPSGSQTYANTGLGGIAGGSGSLWWRKSATADSIPRYWILFGDAYIFYLFVQAGDTVGVYYGYWFGDMYSFRNDPYRTMIHGRCANTTNGNTYRFDGSDTGVPPLLTSMFMDFMPRTWNGNVGSILVNKIVDMGRANVNIGNTNPNGNSTTVMPFSGLLPVLGNPSDGNLTMVPILVCETTAIIRGKMRGMYHLAHPTDSFYDGQIISGSNEYAGKCFRFVKPGPANGGWLMEVSDTLDTN
jgi:hypothetical protein